MKGVASKILPEGSFYYHFGDGYGANIDARGFSSCQHGSPDLFVYWSDIGGSNGDRMQEVIDVEFDVIEHRGKLRVAGVAVREKKMRPILFN